MTISTIRGEMFALLAAFLWAISAVLFERLGKKIRPIEMNLLKGVIATILLGGTLVLLQEPMDGLQPMGLTVLLISGAIGIGIGDTAFFEALKNLGARRTLLLGTLAPPMTALLALIFLGESLASASWLGILITVAGVAWVIAEQKRNGNGSPAGHESHHLRRGVAFGVLASLSQASGLVLSRYAFSFSSISPLQSAILRLIAGSLVVFAYIKFRRQPLGEWRKEPNSLRTGLSLLLVAFVGAYVCIWLQQVAVKLSPAGIAQTLMATSPLFVLPISALRGERLSVRAVLGAAVSLLGIMILFGILG